ncbi:MAG TPA: hypothetical protein VN807_05555, partial [Candidatus Sulfotelmatobacter sp.]|nr:hypothetical protein [Candidatus Sulfotelmatobacter sp.]
MRHYTSLFIDFGLRRHPNPLDTSQRVFDSATASYRTIDSSNVFPWELVGTLDPGDEMEISL